MQSDSLSTRAATFTALVCWNVLARMDKPINDVHWAKIVADLLTRLDPDRRPLEWWYGIAVRSRLEFWQNLEPKTPAVLEQTKKAEG